MSDTRQRRVAYGPAVQVLVLWNFAVAQPLLDLLGRQAAFFTVRRSEPVDVLVLVGLLTLGFPGVLVGIETVAARIGRRPFAYVHAVLVAALVGALAVQPLARIEALPGILALGLAGAAGLAGVYALAHLRALQMMAAVLAPAPLLFAGLFLFGTPVREVVAAREEARAAWPGIGSETPVVMVVFDEFNGAWLLDESGRIDAGRYPNLAALSRRATWFRNATSVSDDTVFAVPAILTGRMPDPLARALPTYRNYPENLFTLLGGSYDLRVQESVARLCPEALCPETAPEPLAGRLRSLVLDLAVVYLHMALVPDLAAGLPVVSQSWKDFTGQDGDAAPAEGRQAAFARFVASIEATPRPPLYFLHILLPHTPWRYLPSGRPYEGLGDASYLEGRVPGEARWVGDEWLVTQAFQRYLVQVAMVDRLVGDLVAHLEAQGLYDRALVIITADHGLSFEPGGPLRAVTDRNLPDVASVPLLVKAPFQRDGVVSDRNVESIDILPTIADILGVEIPWRVDGRSALAPPEADRPVKTVIAAADGRVRRAHPGVPGRQASVARMHRLFGSGDLDGLYRIGRQRGLVGRPVSEVVGPGVSEVTASLDWPGLYEDVDPSGPLVPARIRGTLRTPGAARAPLDLAVAVNGTIEAVTRSSAFEDGTARFSALVPEHALVRGRNRIDVLVVAGPPGRPAVQPTRNTMPATYALLAAADGGLRIIASDDRSIPVVQGAVAGGADGSRQREDGMALVGWAAEVERGRPAQTILVFVDGEFQFATGTGTYRPDVARRYGRPALARSGFHLHLPATLFRDFRQADIRVFAVSRDGRASELPTVGVSLRRDAPR